MRRIALSGQKGKGLYAIVDDANYDLVSSYKWYAMKRKEDGLYIYAGIWDSTNKKRGTLYMHRLIMGVAGNDNESHKNEIDHINGNGLDNRRCNLRICTPSQNQANRDSPSNKLSGLPKGVTAKRDRYYAQIQYKTKKIHLGYYQTIEDAARAYNMASSILFMSFSKPNIIPDDPIWNVANAEKIIGHLDRNRYWDL